MNSIVVIEDDPAIRRGLADTLRSESYDVVTSATGEDGYQLVQERQPDLVILDLRLPGVNGYEVCRRIRRHGLMTPILMLSVDGHERSRVRGFEAGADDYVTKPFSVRELLGRVRAILRRSGGRADLANQRELDDARCIQQQLLPSTIPELPGIRVAGTWRPARITSGDYFDVQKLDDHRLAVCIADACGKGMPAALLMAGLQAAVRAYAPTTARPGQLCERVNRVVRTNVPAYGFISFFYAVIEPGRMIYCNAGHNPPLLARRSGTVERLTCGGGVLGVSYQWRYDDTTVSLGSGDRVLMYTDGITETRNRADDEFGEARLMDALRRCEGLQAAEVVREVIGEASRFGRGDFEDDVTAVAISID